MKAILLPLFLLFTVIGNSQTISNLEKPIHQLRIYEIFKDNKDAFHERFRDHAHRIMKKYDFNIVAIWESEKEDRLEFIYLLEWKNEQTMKDAWAQFMADQEWKDIKAATSKVHGQFVGEIQDRTLLLKDYSPNKQLLKDY